MTQILELDENLKLVPVQNSELEKNQIVWLNGYNQSEYFHDRLAIFEIEKSNYGKYYRTVNIDKPAAIRRLESYGIEPAANIRGIGIYYNPGEFATDEEIKHGLEMVEVFEQEQKELEIKRSEEKKRIKTETLNKFSHLKKTSNEESSRITATKNIRQELKEKFPGIKFSVKSSTFAGGDDININWTDGATVEEIETITNKYQEGHFDGMNDCYDYSDDPFTKLFGGAKYVSANRTLTTERYIETAKKLGYDITINERFEFTGCTYEEKEMIQRETWKTSYYQLPETKEETKKETKQEPAETLENGISIKQNLEKNGIEIFFPSKPSQSVLTLLKSNGWRWSNFNKLWYNRNNETNLEFAKGLQNV